MLGSCDIVKDVISYLFWSWASYRRLTTLFVCFKLVPLEKVSLETLFHIVYYVVIKLEMDVDP